MPEFPSEEIPTVAVILQGGYSEAVIAVKQMQLIADLYRLTYFHEPPDNLGECLGELALSFMEWSSRLPGAGIQNG